MRAGRRVTAFLLLGTGLLAACRSRPPAPLPPIPAQSGSVLILPGPPLASPAVPTDQTLVDRVVAVVNDEPIMMSELQEAVILYGRETQAAPTDPVDANQLQQTVLKRLVEHRLQVQEARREKVQATEEEVSALVDDFVRRNGGDRTRVETQLRAQGLSWEAIRRELRDQLLVQKLRGRRLTRRATVTEPEVDAYVAANRGKLETGLKYHPRHLAILAQPPDQPGAWDRARADIEAIAARLRDGADFAELARAHSHDGSAASGGDLGWLARGELLPLFEEPILKLGKGEVTAPIKSDVAYHLFRLEDREELTAEMLAQLRQQARDLLLQQKAQERFDEWIEELRRRALITVRL
jgi:peptidyl-prolyl cis-trans isomerase SurA